VPSLWDETRVGVFETLQVLHGRPVALEAHWQRLLASQRTVRRPLPPSAARAHLTRAARAMPGGVGGLRLEVTSTAAGPALAIRILPRRSHRPGAGSDGGRGVAVVTAAGRAGSPAALPAQVKSIERIPSVLAWGEAPPEGVFEVLWCNAQGYLVEGTVSNLFIVRRACLMTPPVWAGALAGVVRDALLRLACRLRVPVVEQPFTRHELFTAAEAFLTNSLIGVAPVRVADGRRIGRRCPGVITRRLQRAYAAWRRTA